MPVDDRWSRLSMRDRADLIKIYTKHGVTDLNEIRRHYNSFQDPVFEDRSKPKADLYNRLVDEKDNRSVKIGDGVGTHLMSWATVDDKPVGYSQIQPDNNGNLKDYGDKALDRAIERGDTIQFRDEKDADWWTSNNYKQFYKKMTPAYDEYRIEKLKEKYPFYNTDVMNTKANGGHLFAYGTDGDTPFEQMLRERERQKSIQQTAALLNGTDTRNRTIAQKQQELFPNGVPQRNNAVVYDTDKRRIQEARKHNNDTNGKIWTADVNSEEYKAMKSIPSKVAYDITHPANILDRESTALMNFNPGVLSVNSAIGARDAYNWGDYSKAALLGGLSFSSGLGLMSLPRISGGYANHTELPDFYNPTTGRYEGYKKPSTKLVDVLPWNEFFNKNAETLRPNKFGEFTAQMGNTNTAITPDVIYMDPVERIINNANAQNVKLIEDYPLVFSHSIGNRYLKELFNSKHGSFIMPSVSNRRPYGNGASGLTTLFFDNGLLTDFPHQSFIGDGQTNMLWSGFNMDDFSNMTLDEINQLIESTPNIRDYIKSVAMPTNDETMLLNGRIYDYKLPVNNELFVDDNIDRKLIDDNLKVGLGIPYDEVKFYAGIPFDRVKYAFTQDPEIDELLYKKGVHTNFDIDYHNPAYNDINEYRKYILGIDPTIRYKYGGNLLQYGGPTLRLDDGQRNWLDYWYNNRSLQLKNNLKKYPLGQYGSDADKINSLFISPNKYKKEMFKRADDVPIFDKRKLKDEDIVYLAEKLKVLPLLENYQYDKYNELGAFVQAYGKKPFIGIFPGATETTPLHEYVHAMQSRRKGIYFETPQNIQPNAIKLKLDKNKYNDKYIDDPQEIYSRLMELRYANKINPRHKWNKSELNEFKKKAKDFDILDRYDDDFLLYLFNEVAQNNDNVKTSNYAANGGKLGHITPYGQWQYPHQVTTIPSNNITMQGVDYPVVGVSDTGDAKVMLPGLDYIYDGNYVTEYPVNEYQNGGHLYQGDSEPTQQMRTLYDEASNQIYGILPDINITAKAPKGYNGYPMAFEKEYNNNGGVYGGFTNKDRAYQEWGKTQKYFSPDNLDKYRWKEFKPWIPLMAGSMIAPSATTQLVTAPLAVATDTAASFAADKVVDYYSGLFTGDDFSQNLVNLGVSEKIAPYVAPSMLFGSFYKPSKNMFENITFNRSKGYNEVIKDVVNAANIMAKVKVNNNALKGVTYHTPKSLRKFNRDPGVMAYTRGGTDIYMNPLWVFINPEKYKGTVAHEARHLWNSKRGLRFLSEPANGYFGPKKTFPEYELLKPFEKRAAKGKWAGDPEELVAEMANWKYQDGLLSKQFYEMSDVERKKYIKLASKRFKIKKDVIEKTMEGLSRFGYF